MTQGDENLEIVKTIITLAGNLGMQVIAEEVETEDQLGQLRLLKCQYAQGYLFSKPLAATDADVFILTGRERQLNNSARVGMDITELTNVSLAM